MNERHFTFLHSELVEDGTTPEEIIEAIQQAITDEENTMRH